MALIDITPIMTSNTIPAPYIASASSEYNTTVQAWGAFDNDTVPNGWNAIAGQLPAWLKLDFNVPTKIDAFSLKSSESAGATPKHFILYGSNNDIDYEKIIEINNEVLWSTGSGEVRLYRLEHSVTFRYYKLTIIAMENFTRGAVRELRFLQDDGIQEPILSSKMSLNYCLPKNSTLAMKQRQNDSREGLLGFANDPDNYGTLWMIDNKGKAIIPKASMAKADVLFDGIIKSTSSTGELSVPYTNYKYLIVMAGIDNGIRVKDLIIIPTDSIDTSVGEQYSLDGRASTNFWSMYFSFTTTTTFIINNIASNGWSNIGISKIYGIK